MRATSIIIIIIKNPHLHTIAILKKALHCVFMRINYIVWVRPFDKIQSIQYTLHYTYVNMLTVGYSHDAQLF